MFRIRLASHITIFLASASALFIAGAGRSRAIAQYGGNTVGVPVFKMKDGTERHGAKIFAITWFHGKRLLLCPLHTIQSSGPQIQPREIPEAVSGVDVFDFEGQRTIAHGSHALLRHSSTGMTGNLCDDLAAFEANDTANLAVLGLCARPVTKGTRVWVLSKLFPPVGANPDRFPGIVIESVPTGIDIKMEQPLKAMGSSGSPVVNDRNEVVGMLVGTGNSERTIVNVAPALGIYRRLYAELGQ